MRVPGGHADTNPKGSTVAPDPDLYGPPERGNEDPEADYAAEVYHAAAREYDDAEADDGV